MFVACSWLAGVVARSFVALSSSCVPYVLTCSTILPRNHCGARCLPGPFVKTGLMAARWSSSVMWVAGLSSGSSFLLTLLTMRRLKCTHTLDFHSLFLNFFCFFQSLIDTKHLTANIFKNILKIRLDIQSFRSLPVFAEIAKLGWALSPKTRS